MPSFNQKSKDNLKGCNFILQQLFNEVINFIDCSVICGHRGEAEQNAAFISGASKVKYPDSNHNKFPSKAVDVYPYPYDWEAGTWKLNDLIMEGDIIKINRFLENLKNFYLLAGVGKGIAWELGIKVKWGGDWKNFKDLPHWEVE